jgi:hypothetical protein
MKRFLVLAASAAVLAGAAFADTKADFVTKCQDIAVKQATASLPAGTPEEQKTMIVDGTKSVCVCMGDKLAEMGDDGTKFMEVFLATPEEELMKQGEDQKASVVAKLVEGGMSEADAGAFYDRVNPKAEEAGMACAMAMQEELMKKMAPGGAPAPAEQPAQPAPQ